MRWVVLLPVAVGCWFAGYDHGRKYEDRVVAALTKEAVSSAERLDACILDHANDFLKAAIDEMEKAGALPLKP
jgi:hypothetical protein